MKKRNTTTQSLQKELKSGETVTTMGQGQIKRETGTSDGARAKIWAGMREWLGWGTGRRWGTGRKVGAGGRNKVKIGLRLELGG
jgi:hypothetical protein